MKSFLLFLLLLVLGGGIPNALAQNNVIVGETNIAPGQSYEYSFSGYSCTGDDTFTWSVTGGTFVQNSYNSGITVTWDCSASTHKISVDVGGYYSGYDEYGTYEYYPVYCDTYYLSAFNILPPSEGTPYVAFTGNQPICPNQQFSLTYVGAVGVQQVNWFQWDGTTWQAIGMGTGADFSLPVAGISRQTSFKAQPIICGGAQLSTQTLTVDVLDPSSAGGMALGSRDVLFAANQGVITLADYTGYIFNWQSSVDNGATWIELAESGEQLTYENLTVNTLFRAKLISYSCYNIVYSKSCAIRVGTGELSWIESKSYDDNHDVISNSRSYFDLSGRMIQSQNKNITQGEKILVSQPLFDRYDQVVGTTLAAPIPEVEFTYKPKFVTPISTASAAYNYTHFDGAATNNPVAVGAGPGTLGWYYSTNNTLESNVATTGFPYSRTSEAPDGSTGVVRASGIGEALRMGQGKENVQGVFSVRTELDPYNQFRNQLFPIAVTGEQTATLAGAATQQVVINANGQKTVTFQDKEGHTVMSARPGSANNLLGIDSNVEIGWPYLFTKDANQLYTAPVFEATSDIQVYDTNSNLVFMGHARDFDLRNRPDSYRIYSNEPFRIVTGPVLNASTNQPISWNSLYEFYPTKREAFALHNFYTFQDAPAKVTPLTNAYNYTVVNTITGADVTSLFKSNATIAAGFYQIRILYGAVQVAYHNDYQDISFSFYNQKGQLLGSLAPKGTQVIADNIRAMGYNPFSTPATLPFYTSYSYDVRGRLLSLTETDAGTTHYYYRNDGKVRFSQSAKQQPLGYFSYTNYDEAGRPVESGECRPANTGYLASIATDPTTLESTNPRGGFSLSEPRYSVVLTSFDLPVALPTLTGTYVQGFLAGRISSTLKYDTWVPQLGAGTPVSQSWFSYDEQGRSQWVVRKLLNQSVHTLNYEYDLLGNVLSACYQLNDPTTRFTHYYSYNSNQQLIEVSTNKAAPTDLSSQRKVQAAYSYYLHGPLKRVVIGELQGVDYLYTAQGWLKSINGIAQASDPGQDSPGTTGMLPDLFSQELEYFSGDYASAGRPGNFSVLANNVERFDGTLRALAWRTPSHPGMHGYSYRYDERGQLSQADYGQPVLASGSQNISFTADPLKRYAEGNLTYDPNGNLLSLQRTDRLGQYLMNINYQYLGNTNKLQKVSSQVPTVSGMDYTYDELGQLTTQVESGTAKYFDYDVSGKVTAVYRDAAKTNPLAQYVYDEFGQRIKQTVFDASGAADATLYVRDAAGHEVASYYYNASTPTLPQLAEQPIYGATRLGVVRQPRGSTDADQLYELTDQLGNTRVVFHAPRTTSYVLTMEDQRVAQEKQDFTTPDATTYDEVRSSAYARQASPYGQDYSMYVVNRVGPGKKIAVAPGDRVLLEVYAGTPFGGTIAGKNNLKVIPFATGSAAMPAQFQRQTNETAPSTQGWQRALGQIAVGISIPLFRKQAVNNNLARGSSPDKGTSPPVIPQASLQYVLRLVRDQSVVRSGRVPVTKAALGAWQLLSSDVQIDTEEPAELEVWVQSDDRTPVYFDDLRIENQAGPIVQENHFYAYGQRNDGLSWTRQYQRPYGRGYQGQDTRFDAETGYDNFELRLYDARIGRWLSTDPMGQYFSPYIAMGNDPIDSVDPDGGKDGDPPTFPTKPTGGQLHSEGDRSYIYNSSSNSWSNLLAEVSVTVPSATVNSVSFGFAFLGGMGVEYGHITDYKGITKSFYSINANVGFGLTVAGFNHTEIHRNEAAVKNKQYFDIDNNFAGQGNSWSVGFGLFSASYGGDHPNNNGAKALYETGNQFYNQGGPSLDINPASYLNMKHWTLGGSVPRVGNISIMRSWSRTTIIK